MPTARITLVLAGLLAGCVSDGGPSAAPDLRPAGVSDLDRRLTTPELLALGPLGLLDRVAALEQGWVTVDTVLDPAEGLASGRAFGVDDWVGPDDLAALLERLDDPEPAAGIVSARSSVVPLGDDAQGTTVGRMAAFLIETARTGYFPPRLSSYGYFRSDPEELRVWAERAVDAR